jgi:hypothetical protein
MVAVMKNKKETKPSWKMNTRELARATKEFDKEIPSSKVRPMNREERERWERARRLPSRSIYILDDGSTRRSA